ncbi:MAG: hypothetical protein AB7G06_04700 [Bdellovibrionales bacterium]
MSNIQNELKQAAADVMARRSVIVPAAMALQFAEIDARRSGLRDALNWCDNTVRTPINDNQYLMLVGFLKQQAAGKDVDILADADFSRMITE